MDKFAEGVIFIRRFLERGKLIMVKVQMCPIYWTFRIDFLKWKMYKNVQSQIKTMRPHKKTKLNPIKKSIKSTMWYVSEPSIVHRCYWHEVRAHVFLFISDDSFDIKLFCHQMSTLKLCRELCNNDKEKYSEEDGFKEVEIPSTNNSEIEQS